MQISDIILMIDAIPDSTGYLIELAKSVGLIRASAEYREVVARAHAEISGAFADAGGHTYERDGRAHAVFYDEDADVMYEKSSGSEGEAIIRVMRDLLRDMDDSAYGSDSGRHVEEVRKWWAEGRIPEDTPILFIPLADRLAVTAWREAGKPSGTRPACIPH